MQNFTTQHNTTQHYARFYIKIILSIVAVLLISACQQDDNLIKEPEKSLAVFEVQELDAEAISGNSQLISEIKNLNKHRSEFGTTDNRGEITILDLYKVSDLKANKIVSGSLVSYTLQLMPRTHLRGVQQSLNLVLVPNQQDGYDNYVIVYNLTPTQLWQRQHGEEVTGELDYFVIKLDTKIRANSTSLKGVIPTDGCPDGYHEELIIVGNILDEHGQGEFVEYIIDCVEDVEPVNPSYTKDGSGGGGGGGNAGGYSGGPIIIIGGGGGTPPAGGPNGPGNGSGGNYGGGVSVGGDYNYNTPTLPVLELRPAMAFYGDLTQEQKDWWNNPDNAEEVNLLIDYLDAGGSVELAEDIFEILKNNPDVTWDEIENWFLMEPTPDDNGEPFDINDYSSIEVPTYDDLPSLNDFVDAFPKSEDNRGMMAKKVYELVGGSLLNT